MTTPTLPGTIPGLLRRGSPLILRPRVYGEVTLLNGGGGVVHDEARGLAVTDTFGGSTRIVRYGREDVSLDLSDPTGRAHAAWWLASALLPRERIVNATVMPGRTIGPVVYGLATLDVVNGDRWRRSDPSPFECTDHLDVYDPRLLPDGSRWVDAEALRLVCLHVAGVRS